MTVLLTYKVINGYRLQERIGRGGIAEVYRAESMTSQGTQDRQVAVKVMFSEAARDPLYVKAFKAEFDFLQELGHKSVPKAYALGAIDGRPAIIMEYMAGPTLYALHAEAKKFDQAKAFYALVNAVAHLHQSKLIHNDIKLENVIIRPTGLLALVDFGNVKRMGGTASISAFLRSKPKAIFGTPTYLAPEIILGGRPSYQSDVYALGVCAHMLIGGRPPYDDPTTSARMRSATGRAMAPTLSERNPNALPSLVKIVDSCILKDRDARPLDACQLKHLLKTQCFSSSGKRVAV